MAKTFLEQALAVKPTRPSEIIRYDHGGGRIVAGSRDSNIHGESMTDLIADCYEPKDNREAIYLALRCWPEILAVVEAAQDVQPDRSTIEETVNDLIGAVDALDRKAGE